MRFKFILLALSQHWVKDEGRGQWQWQEEAKGAASNGACRTHAKLPPATDTRIAQHMSVHISFVYMHAHACECV